MSTLAGPRPLTGSGTLAGSLLSTQLRALGTFDADVCMNCGICTAACPLKIDVLPRLVMRFGVLGFDDQLRAEKEAVFSCLLCRACEVSCPAGVRITDNIHALPRRLLEEES